MANFLDETGLYRVWESAKFVTPHVSITKNDIETIISNFKLNKFDAELSVVDDINSIVLLNKAMFEYNSLQITVKTVYNECSSGILESYTSDYSYIVATPSTTRLCDMTNKPLLSKEHCYIYSLNNSINFEEDRTYSLKYVHFYEITTSIWGLQTLSDSYGWLVTEVI